ncbi:MAG: adenosylmethionine decarboxylase [Methylococcus sp.]|nr:MAG: adenosylmethionine decarboxylase [Methylococcus sp.]
MSSMGRHLIIECRGGQARLSERELETLLVAAAEGGGATILRTFFHSFGLGKGITGVVLLAESHITVHTWPECDYAAFDLFMCGDSRPEKAAEIITTACPDAVTSIRIISRERPEGVQENALRSCFSADASMNEEQPIGSPR